MMFNFNPARIIGLAFAFHLGAMALTFGLAKLARSGTSGLALILVGVFIGAFLLALVELIQLFVPDSVLPFMIYWLLGSFVGADETKVLMIAISGIHFAHTGRLQMHRATTGPMSQGVSDRAFSQMPEHREGNRDAGCQPGGVPLSRHQTA